VGVWEEEEEEKSKGNKKREEKGPAADDGEGPRRTQRGMQRRTGSKAAASSKSKEAGAGGGGKGSKRGSGRELHGNTRMSGMGALWERVRTRFGPFFSFAHKTKMEQQRTLCPTRKKIFCFQKILLSGSPTTEFYFPQKGPSVSNSYFYSSMVFYTNTYMENHKGEGALWE
jgi:hypothetical protein